MDRCKYIIFDNGTHLDVPVIFPAFIEHSAIKRYVPGHWSVISAGFVCLADNDLVVAHGESITLKKGSREEDTNILRKLLGAEE